jgi:DUF4097 and DUF4098 domain-containing protein YvlB
MLINISTRKGAALPMKNKNIKSVSASLEKHKSTDIPINYLYSDQDISYKSKTMTEWFKKK